MKHDDLPVCEPAQAVPDWQHDYREPGRRIERLERALREMIAVAGSSRMQDHKDAAARATAILEGNSA